MATMLLGSFIGVWIDNNERILAVKVFLLLQNTCIAAACTGFAIYFYLDVKYNSIMFAAICIALSVFSELGALGIKIVVERD